MTAELMPSAASVWRRDWITDRRRDLGFIIGGVGFSLVFLALHVGAQIDAAILWWGWIVLLDGPHIFATLSRTYLDKQERQQRRRLLLGSLLWFGLGPACFGLALLVKNRLVFDLFMVFASLWAYWHVVRQHYGIMVLYKKKNQDMAPTDNRIDAFLVYAGQIAPFVSFAVSHPTARRMLGLGTQMTWESSVMTAAWLVFAAAVLLFLARQLHRYRTGQPINGPKALLLLSVIGLAAILFSPPVVARAQFVAFAIIVTAFHNVQYHTVVWMYHRRRYHRDDDNTDFGWAPKISRRFMGYAIAGIAFTLAYRSFGCSLGSGAMCSVNAIRADWPLGLTPRDLVAGFMWGFALHHYYLDQKIWRVRRDPRLNQDLDLERSPTA